MSKATKERKRPDGKPYPYSDFPLTAHPSGRWCKKVRIGNEWKIKYFGRWYEKVKVDGKWSKVYLGNEAAEEALKKYKDQEDDLFLGREPQAAGETVRDLLNTFLASKQTRVDTRELAACTFADYQATCERIAECFGRMKPLTSLTIADFESLRGHLTKGKQHKITGKRKRLGLVALKGELTQARMVFGYAADMGVILPYRKALKSPSRKNLRKVRNEQGERMFEAAEIRALIEAADPQLKAMIYLGINAAMGPTDLGRLTHDKIKDGWQTMPRAKNGSERRASLWPESQKAIADYLKERPEPKPGNERLVFLTKYGNSSARESGDNAISSEFAKLMDSLKLHRPGNNFYSLRRTLETVGSHCGPQHAVDRIMGHAPDSDDMSAVYRQRVPDSALLKVADYVRQWLKGTITLED